MGINQILDRWKKEPTIFDNVAAWQDIPARAARYAPIPHEIHPSLQRALINRGVRKLYTHQEIAYRLVQAGENIVISTGTASGKTLCYNLPVLQELFSNDKSRSLYIFPTKALAQDQLHEVRGLIEYATGDEVIEQAAINGYAQFKGSFPSDTKTSHILHSFPAAVYDGDTPNRARQLVRENARLILTNPDMLHTGILPHHTRWELFFRDLRYVIIDEMHVYRGVFGSHVANVIRRLKRIAAHYGSKPQFILTSATIANPLAFAEKLIEDRTSLIAEDGSSRGPGQFLIYNPPIVDPELGLRRSSLLESVRLADELLRYNLQIIVFGRSRRAVELILTYLRGEASNIYSSSQQADLLEGSNEINEIIRGYRSGYLPEVRREIERGLREGTVRGVVATTALELGIDIGQMGASLLVGYPGSIASTWQQAGRAGRGIDPSLTLLIASAGPLDQFLAHHPDYFFDRSPEQALINPDNLLILLAHLRCALFELPFEDRETYGNWGINEIEELLEFLVGEGSVHKSGSKYFWMSEGYPAEAVPLRTASPIRVQLQVKGDTRPILIGEVDYESATWMVHPNAIYLHESEVYLVDELDLEHGFANLSHTNVDYYTEPKIDTNIQLLELLEQVSVPGGKKSHGEIRVTSQVKGYKCRRWLTHETIGAGGLDLPPFDLNTTGYWLSFDRSAVDLLRELGLWSSDPNRYGPEWDLIRGLVRARDNYKCQVCGTAEQGQAHHVHHKKPFREFTSLEEANQLSNLLTLCPACHRKVELNVRLRSGLSGLTYVLGNLAPLFLMCDNRDLGVFSDPKAVLADGDAAIVLYDRIPAGIGFSEKLFELHSTLIESSRDLVQSCSCNEGCPSCVGPAGENGTGGKEATLALIDVLSQTGV